MIYVLFFITFNFITFNLFMPEPIIKIRNLEITYNLGKVNEYKATKGVNMDIYPGEFIAFFGPSGCGKSTLFYCILGILAPSAGELYVLNRNPYSFSPEEMVKFQTTTIGIIYQSFFLINSLSVSDNVALPQIFHGVSPSKRQEWARQLLKRFDMDMHSQKYPDNLSGGQSQRVSVARSMVNNPKILLADEPTGNLDSISTKQVMEALDVINKVDKKTVIIITHNAAQLSYAHRVFYMKDGLLERVVPNPEKKQIAKIDKQKILVTEFDRLSKIFPYNSPVELKVKSIVNFLTQDFDFDQLLKLEEFTQLVVERKMGMEEYAKVLALDFEKGGVGAPAPTAKIMAEKVFRILKQSEDVGRFRRRFMSNNFFFKENELIKRVSQYLIDEYDGKTTPEKRKRIRELIYKRLSGLIKKEDFQQLLASPLESGGVGLTKTAARKLNFYFEKMIIQGIEHKGNH
jgi:ABC-type lipoprotein export system ATPase subunit